MSCGYPVSWYGAMSTGTNEKRMSITKLYMYIYVNIHTMPQRFADIHAARQLKETHAL